MVLSFLHPISSFIFGPHRYEEETLNSAQDAGIRSSISRLTQGRTLTPHLFIPHAHHLSSRTFDFAHIDSVKDRRNFALAKFLF
jgi:hypothetical protein